MLKPSDSSFGLHSPDLMANTTEEKDLEGLLRRLQDDPSLPYGEESLYLDPDIIDLTMIPPPITPEEDGIKLPTTLNEPPTPFADRDSLENELAALKNPSVRNWSSPSDLGELRELSDLAQWSDLGDSPGLADVRETDFIAASSGARSSSSSVSTKSLTESKRRWIADEKRKYLSNNPGLDQFLSSVAVPLPPTTGGKGATPSQLPVSSFNDDLSAYIIPPPPVNVGNATANNGLAILQKLYAAREGVSQVMRGDEQDRGVGEARVRSEQREQQGVSQKIGDIQRMLLSSAGASHTAPLGLVPSSEINVAIKGTTPDLSPASSQSSGYGSLRSITECSSNPPELPARLPAGPSSPRKNGMAPFKAVPLNRPIGLKSSGFKPTLIDVDDNIPPPPPPPRNPIPRMIAASSRISSASTKVTFAPSAAPLTKSSSQVIRR